MPEIDKLIITIQGDISSIKKDMKDLRSSFNNTDSAHKGFVDNIKTFRASYIYWAAAIAGVGLAIKNLGESFGRFEHRMREVLTLTDLNTQEFEKYKDAVLGMTQRIPQSADELAAALYDVVSAGIAVADSNEVLELSAKAAVAGVTDTKTAAKAGLAILNAYGKEVNELGEVYDVLFQTVKLGVITFEEIASTIGNVLPSAVAAGVGIEEIAASFATMTKSGIDAAQTSTALRAGLIKLAAPTGEGAEAMQRMGIEWNGWLGTLKQIKDLNLGLRDILKIIPDERSAKAVLSLTQNFETLEKTMRAYGTAVDPMEKAFETMRESPVNQMKLLSNSITNLKIALAQTFAPAIITGIKGLTGALNALYNLTKSQTKEEREINEILDSNISKREKINQLENVKNELLRKTVSLKDQIDILEGKELGSGMVSRRQVLISQLTKTKDTYDKITEALKQVKKETDSLVRRPTGEGFEAETKAPKIIDEKDIEIQIESLKIFEAQTKQALQGIVQEFQTNQISIQEYYEARRQAAIVTFEQEKRVLEEYIARLDDEEKKRKANEELIVKEIELKTKLNQINFEGAQAGAQVTESIEQEIQQRLFDLRTDSRQKEIDQETQWYNKRKSQLEQYNLDTEDLTEAHKKKIREINDRYNQEDLENELESLKNKVDAYTSIGQTLLGAIDNIIQARLNRIDREREAEINRIKLTVSAREDQNNEIARINSKYDAEARKAAEARRRIALFEAAITVPKMAIDAYSAFAGIYAIGPALGAAAAIAATAFGLTKMAAISAAGYREGGEVRGPGGIDNVSARLTSGEYVQSKPAVDYYGKGAMEALNKQVVPRDVFATYNKYRPRIPSRPMFQEGGLVANRQFQNQVNAGTVQITNIVDPDLINQYLLSSQGQEVLLNVISNNSYNIKRSLQT